MESLLPQTISLSISSPPLWSGSWDGIVVVVGRTFGACEYGCCILPESTSEVPWASGTSGGSWMEKINFFLIPFKEMRLQKLFSITSGCMGCVLDLYYTLVETICPIYLEQWTMSSLIWKFYPFIIQSFVSDIRSFCINRTWKILC